MPPSVLPYVRRRRPESAHIGLTTDKNMFAASHSTMSPTASTAVRPERSFAAAAPYTQRRLSFSRPILTSRSHRQFTGTPDISVASVSQHLRGALAGLASRINPMRVEAKAVLRIWVYMHYVLGRRRNTMAAEVVDGRRHDVAR